MINENYVPSADKERSAWLMNFAAQLRAHSAELEIEAPEVNAIEKDAAMFCYLVVLEETFKKEARKRVSFKNAMAYSDGYPYAVYPSPPVLQEMPEPVSPGIFKRVLNMICRIKNHPSYNERLGYEFRITGAEMLMNNNKLKPELKISIDGGKPVIRWVKGMTDSLDIYVQRRPMGLFEFLANSTQQNFIDTYHMPMSPTLWSYRAIYKAGEDHVGQVSDTVSVSVMNQVDAGINFIN